MREYLYYMDLVNRCAVTLSIEIMRYLQHFQLVLDLFNIVEYLSVELTAGCANIKYNKQLSLLAAIEQVLFAKYRSLIPKAVTSEMIYPSIYTTISAISCTTEKTQVTHVS